MGSDRIAAHNLHTDPSSTDPRAQEKWQGVHGVSGTICTAAKIIKSTYDKSAATVLKQKEQKALKRKQVVESAVKEKINKRKRSSSSSGGKRSAKMKVEMPSELNEDVIVPAYSDVADLGAEVVSYVAPPPINDDDDNGDRDGDRDDDSDEGLWEDCFRPS